ncbi:hypothetical protein GDO86_013776, partial [Hymenochirus boettgeri]
VISLGSSVQYSSDLCNWKGSGLTHETHAKDVEQVYLRCSEGSVEWLYPTGALVINLRPNTLTSVNKHFTVCIKPFTDSKGANIYVEKSGELSVVVPEGEISPSKVYCFSLEQRRLYIEATPQLDISRKITGFQYELISQRTLSDLRTVSVVKGSIRAVTSEQETHESFIDVAVGKLYRQKNKIFLPKEGGGWEGTIRTNLECGVKTGMGNFLFTGRMHFGEPRMGCAPRYRDFKRIYLEAKNQGLNPCEISMD